MFLISALEGGEWIISRPGRSISAKEQRYPLNKNNLKVEQRHIQATKGT